MTTTTNETKTKTNGAKRPLNAHASFQKLAEEITSRLINRGEEVLGMLVALIAGENLVLLGPPGTAKSMLARALAEGVESDAYYETLLSRYSTPEQLFGPVSLTGLQQDRFRRVTKGYLPEADIAFLDEIFKAGPGVLNTLLPVLNERVFHDEGQAKPTPLKIVIGASNEMPEGESLSALWDRFPLRYWVAPLSNETDRRALEKMAAQGWQPVPLCVTKGSLELARYEAKRLTVPESVIDAKLRLRRELEKEGIVTGDRRWVKATRLLQAHAWLRGSDKVSALDLEVLQHAFWDKPEQRAKVTEIVGRACGDSAKARNIADRAIESVVGWEGKPPEERATELTKLARARVELKRLLERADPDVGVRIRTEHKRVTAMRDAILASISGDADLTPSTGEDL